MQLFTGEVNAKKRKEIWKTADIIFSTPQCIANDLRNHLYDMEGVCLLIEDEAHRCVKSYDYRYVAEKYKEKSSNARILGMTASPGSEISKVKEICNNLFVEEVELRTRESPDVSPYLKELKTEKVMLDLPEDFIKIRTALSKLFNEYVDELRNRKVFFGFASKTELIKLQKKIFMNIAKGNKNFNNLLAVSACAQAIKIQHALELLETQTVAGFNKYLKELKKKAESKDSKGVVRLVSKPEFNYALMKSDEILEKGIEHPKVLELIKIIEREKKENEKTKVIIFTQFRETARIVSKKINEASSLKSKVFVGQTKKTDNNNGETSGLSQDEQKKVIKDFSSGKIDVICATSIGEEGLDIPEVSLVIFYEPVPSAIRTIQRGGRTARLSDGKIIFLITKKTRDEAYFYASKSKEKKMHSAISSVKENLLAEFDSDIDPDEESDFQKTLE
jgi:Fanconi anemia group M protein